MARTLTLLSVLLALLAPVAAHAAAEAGEFEISLPAGAQAIVLVICVLYFLAVLAFGFMFGRFSKDTHDFFYSGQRFPWWLVVASMIATASAPTPSSSIPSWASTADSEAR